MPSFKVPRGDEDYDDYLKALAEMREKAVEDKADLFDFYHDNWDTLLAELNYFISLASNVDRED